MTASRSSGSGATHNHHRHTKSGSAIGSGPPAQQSTPHSKVQPHHNAAHQLQSPAPRGTADVKSPRTPKSDAASSRKKRRQRKPKDTAKNSPEQANPNMSDSAVTQSSPEQTTPTKSLMDSPGKAYAGPGFHHSPAPSSLPVPKFFSKSVPARRTPGLQAMLDDSESTDGSQSSSSPPLDNPLEQLFRADREEKARKNRQSSDGSDSDSIPERDIFGMDPDSPVRHVFNTPRSSVVRPGAERATTEPLFTMDSLNGSLPSSPVQSTPRHNEADRQAKSAALRQFLLQQPGVSPAPYPTVNTSPSPSPVSRTHVMVSPQGSPLPQRFHARPMSFGRPPPRAPQFRTAQYSQPRSPVENASPSRPQFSNIFDSRYDSRTCRTESHDVINMENSLRQILKLDPRPNIGGGVMI